MTVSSTSKIIKVNSKIKKRSQFFSDFKNELKKVSWSTKEELKLCTKIVVGSIFFLGIGIYLVDIFIRSFLLSIEFLLNLFERW